MSALHRVDVHLLACFYEGVTNPQRFCEGLQRIGELLDCDRVSLKIWDRRGYWACSSEAIRHGDQWTFERSDNDFAHQGLRSLLNKFESGQWKLVEQWRLLPQTGEAQRATFQSDGEMALCTRLTLRQAEAMLSLVKRGNRWKDTPLPIDHANDACCALLPALDPIARLRQSSQQLATLSAMLNSFRIPIMLLDSSQRLLENNAAAMALFGSPLRIALGKVAASLPGIAESQFSRLVAQACGKPASAGVIKYPMKVGAPLAHVLVLPVLMHRTSLPQPAALVLVQGINGATEQASQLLQTLYGLTLAEARLAELILEGQSPGKAALQLQVSVATVRTQLSAVLKKTGAQRQSDLVRRLSPLLILNHGLGSD